MGYGIFVKINLSSTGALWKCTVKKTLIYMHYCFGFENKMISPFSTGENAFSHGEMDLYFHIQKNCETLRHISELMRG
eukprot:UN20968